MLEDAREGGRSAPYRSRRGNGIAYFPPMRMRNNVKSIKQKPRPPAARALPDFRNLGVILRILLAVNLMAGATVLLRMDLAGGALRDQIITMAGRIELPLLLAVLVFYLLQPWLVRIGPWAASAVIFAVVAALVPALWPLLPGGAETGPWRPLAWAGGATALCLFYFDYRNRFYSPALAEARLLALTARIRPHFLFNCLNGVLGVIRSDPHRAETALEEMADLFRALMQENRELTPLGDELTLCRRYLGLEQLRLGERLSVRWEIKSSRGNAAALRQALVPPLLLQPLLENAVYHGIESSPDGGEIVVRIERRGGELRLEVDNPVAATAGHRHAGNRMALDNIRERLALFFDLEAGLDIHDGKDRYRVRLRLPFRSVS